MENEIQKILLDTNVLLTDPDIVSKNPEKYAICLTTLRELDKLKRKPELNYAVRRAIKSIFFNLKDLRIDINEEIDYDNLTNDEKIILSAKKNNFTFRTEDIGAMVIAESMFGVVLDTDLGDKDDLNRDYKGYKELFIEDIEIWTQLYHCENAEDSLVMEFGENLDINEYKAILNKENNEEYILIQRNFEGDVIQVPLKLYKKVLTEIGIKIRPLDVYQWIALDSVLNDNPFSIIDGILGTGKTLMAIMGALMTTESQNPLFKKYKQIYVTRPPIAIDKRYEQGFLPGELENKMAPWLISFKSNLEFIYNSFGEEENKGEEMFLENFKPVSLEHIQGASIHNSILLVDEYQFLDEDMLKQILSRIASGSKVILIGDPDGQTYNVNRGHEGFKTLRKHIKSQKLLSYVKLEKVYRSKLAEFVERIFSF